MTARGLLLVALAAITTVAGNLLMRGGVVDAGGLKLTGTLLSQLLRLAKQPMFMSGVFLYGVSAIIWFSIISSEQLSSAYPILVSMTFILVTAGSVVFFHEGVSIFKAIGIIVILTGIWMVAQK